MVISWPGKQRSLHYLKLATLLSIQFVAIYGGANLLSQQRTDVHQIYFDWELSIPLLPSMVWIYASIVPLMLSPLFFLDSHHQTHLAKQLALAMVIAGSVFLLFPGTIGYEPTATSSSAIEFIRLIDLPYNVFPSLHVALSSTIMLHLYRVFGTSGRWLLAVWLGALIVSVILTHQHHVADVFGGAILAWLCHKLLPRPISR
jgi:membrane-associated phospholipid phosphatase